MATLLKITCPKCNYTWEVDYARLQQERRPLYKGIAAPGSRREEYIVRCPNPQHGEEVVITLDVEE